MRNLTETLDLINSGKLSPEEHLSEVLENIKEDENINSFISLGLEAAKEMAKNSKEGPLRGAVVGIKDNVNVKGMKTTCASKILKDFESVFDADVTKSIRNSGATILGKLNMDEFAMGSSNESSYFGPVKNPLDNSLVPGGSSGGSAAAVAMGFVDVAIGTDTGGSIRQPASFCSVVGIKPTYGAVSRYGVQSLANTFDTVGTLGRSVEDAYLFLQNIACDTQNDMTKIKVDLPDLYKSHDQAIENLKGKKIAIFKNFDDFDFEDGVRDAYDKSIKALQDAGAIIVEDEFKYLDFAVAAYYTLVAAECSSNISRFDGIRYSGIDYTGSIEDYMTKVRSEGLNESVKRRVLLGMYILSSKNKDQIYGKALEIRQAIRNDYDRIFKNADVILTPTVNELAFKLGSKTTDPKKMMEGDILSVSPNMAGLPAISVPSTSERKINAGMHFIGNKKDDANLARIAMAYEGLVK